MHGHALDHMAYSKSVKAWFLRVLSHLSGILVLPIFNFTLFCLKTESSHTAAFGVA